MSRPTQVCLERIREQSEFCLLPIREDIKALLSEIDALKAEKRVLIKAVGEHVTVRSELRAEVEALREALISECPCTCRPHALGKDKPLTCLRCRALAARQPTEGR